MSKVKLILVEEENLESPVSSIQPLYTVNIYVQTLMETIQ